MRSLVVEDEHKLASALKRGLEEHGCAVDVAYRRRRRPDPGNGGSVRVTKSAVPENSSTSPVRRTPSWSTSLAIRTGC